MDNAKKFPSDRELRGRVIYRMYMAISHLLIVHTAVPVSWEERLGME